MQSEKLSGQRRKLFKYELKRSLIFASGIRSIILILFLLSLLTGCSDSGNNKAHTGSGSIDLREWDFKTGGPVALNSDWEFYNNRKLSPSDFADPGIIKKRAFTRLSGIVNPGIKLYIPEYYKGFATYKLKVITDVNKSGNLGLRIHTINASYEMFINGSLVHKNGMPVKDVDSFSTGYATSVLPLHSADGIYEIIIQADNYTFPYGSVDYDIDIGRLSSLQMDVDRENILAVFYLIAIFSIGLYQLVIFYLQRKERRCFYFGLLCIFALMSNIGMHHVYWSGILPFVPWDNIAGLLISLIYAADTFFYAYLRQLFPDDVSQRFVYAYGIINVILAICIVVLPAEMFAYLVAIYHVHAIVSVLIFIFIAIRVIRLRRENSLIILTGALAGTVFGLLMFMLTVFDILSGDGDVDYQPFSMLIFCLIQTIGTTRDFIKKHRSLVVRYDDKNKQKNNHGIGKQEPFVIPGNIESKIKTSIDYLQLNFLEDISRENLAASVDLHPDNFSRYFRVHTGKKYVEYLNDLRIEEAVKLLEETELPIDEIAAKSGFRSSRTFNHAFIKAKGRKPSNYRNN